MQLPPPLVSADDSSSWPLAAMADVDDVLALAGDGPPRRLSATSDNSSINGQYGLPFQQRDASFQQRDASFQQRDAHLQLGGPSPRDVPPLPAHRAGRSPYADGAGASTRAPVHASSVLTFSPPQRPDVSLGDRRSGGDTGTRAGRANSGEESGALGVGGGGGGGGVGDWWRTASSGAVHSRASGPAFGTPGKLGDAAVVKTVADVGDATDHRSDSE